MFVIHICFVIVCGVGKYHHSHFVYSSTTYACSLWSSPILVTATAQNWLNSLYCKVVLTGSQEAYGGQREGEGQRGNER